MKIFLIGPGGVGKSTCGELLAKLLWYKFIDLDDEFCRQVENIGFFIKNFGYEEYCYKNSELFYSLTDSESDDFVFALSSGFLVHKNLEKLTIKHKNTLKESGISILLLPSDSLDESVNIIIKRQLSRGFWLNKKKEKTKFIWRFPLYGKLGDIKIFSHDKPEIIAKQMKREMYLYIN